MRVCALFQRGVGDVSNPESPPYQCSIFYLVCLFNLLFSLYFKLIVYLCP